jgi:putative transposase
LSKLAVWWLRLGIRLERIAPGHPEQNGRHERMHLTLKLDATRPAAYNVLQQQMRFDTFLHRYNHERPHQALEMATPASRYTPSVRLYRGLEELDHPFHDWTAVVTRCGRICYQRRKINLSQVFAGQKVGVKQTAEHIWLVTFMEYDLGYFDDETCRLEPIDDPFGPRLLPMSPEWTESVWTESVTPPLGIECYPSDQKGPKEVGSSGWIRTSNPPVNRRAFTQGC